MNVNDLRKAIVSRETEKEFIKSDLDEVDFRLDAFRNYFNAVYHHVIGVESARFRCTAGYISSEQLKDKIMELDNSRRIAHESAINACSVLNRLCDMHGVEHLCPEVQKDERGVVINRDEIADFAGQFVYNTYQKGINGPSLEEIRQEKGYPTQFDAAFAIAEEQHRDPNEAYAQTDAVENYDDFGDFDPGDDF